MKTVCLYLDGVLHGSIEFHGLTITRQNGTRQVLLNEYGQRVQQFYRASQRYDDDMVQRIKNDVCMDMACGRESGFDWRQEERWW